MQADEAGLRETVLEGKTKECQGFFWTLAFFVVPKFGVPKGI